MGSGAFLVQVCRWLSERLVEAWGKETGQGKFITVDGVALESAGSAEPMPDSLDERLLIARRLVAEKCLYGVDLNPLAVELAKLSIWLITLAKGRPFGFLDHNLRSGDSLLGLHKLEQLTKFSLHPEKKKTISMFASNIEAAVTDALTLRKQLRETPIRDIRDVQYMERLDQEARQKLEHIEHIADAMIGEALASGGNQRALESAMDNLSTWAAAYIEGDNETGRKIIAEARKSLSIDLPAGKPPRKPFHWALEFPEVFQRGGFDGIVGNPPFMGGRKISSSLGVVYLNYLINSKSSINGIADFVCHFLRRAFQLIRSNGLFGLIATKSISEVDSRRGGLGAIIDEGGVIFSAETNKPWPGKAAVVVSIAHVIKGNIGRKSLNGVDVEFIPPSLTLEEDESQEPKKLIVNLGIGRSGSKIMGDGFKLSYEEGLQLIKSEPASRVLIKQLLGGTDLTTEYNQYPSRLVIDPEQRTESEMKSFPLVYGRLKEQVFPSRSIIKDVAKKKYWWRFAGTSKALYDSIKTLETCLVSSRVTKHVMFELLPTNSSYGPLVFDESVVVVSFSDFFHFGCLHSAFHNLWVMRWGSMMGTTQRYTPTEVLETFPFPCSQSSLLENISKEYQQRRKGILNELKVGLTEFYNLVHSPEEDRDLFVQFRKLQTDLDVAVSDSYGWDDLELEHGFHETKHGIRFIVSESTQREVLQRLLKLNHERYEEEVAQGLHDKKKKKTSTPRKKKTSPAKDDGNMDLFNFMNVSPKGSK